MLPLCLLACVLLATGTSFAAYSSASSAADGSRVAGGGLTVAFEQGTDPNGGYSYSDGGGVTVKLERPDDASESDTVAFSFTISNGSSPRALETAIAYGITVTLPDDLPDGVSAALYRAEDYQVGNPGSPLGSIAASEGAGGLAIRVPNAGTFAAGNEGRHEYTLVLTGDFSQIPSSADRIYEDASIIVDAAQID